METTGNLIPWDQYMYYGIAASISIGVLFLIYYEVRVLRINDFKEKYDFVNLNEIRFFWYAVICFLIAGAFAINTVASRIIAESGTKWFFVRVFISLSFIVIGYFVLHSLIRI